MNASDPDQIAFEQIMAMPENKAELARVSSMLDEDIRNMRFNRDRAGQVFLMALDKSALRFFKGIGAGGMSATLFPKPIRERFARVLCDAFLKQRGNPASQRPTRTGLSSHLLGK